MRVISQAFTIGLLVGSFNCAVAQVPMERTVERSVTAVPNKDTRIGVYLNVLPDCTSGPLPTIRLVSPPTAGKVVVRTAKAKATNYKACLALEVPAYVAFYKSPPEFLGDDVLTIEVKYAGGRTEIQKITVKVSGPGGQRTFSGHVFELGAQLQIRSNVRGFDLKKLAARLFNTNRHEG